MCALLFLQKNHEYRRAYEDYVKSLPADDQARLKEEEQSKQAKAQVKAASKASSKLSAATKRTSTAAAAQVRVTTHPVS